MAVPVFRAAGTWVFNANNVPTTITLTPTKSGSTVNGDCMILISESRSNSAACATPTGWDLLTGFPKSSGTASGGRIYIWTRIADGTGSDAPSVVWTGHATGTSGDTAGAGILSYQNVTETIDGTAAVSDLSAQTNSSIIPAQTTGFDPTLVIGAVFKIGAESGTSTVATFTERVDTVTTSGTGHVMEVSEKVQTPPGSTGTATVTWSLTTSLRALAVSVGLQATTTFVPLQSASAVSGTDTLALATPAPVTIPLQSAAAVSGSAAALSAKARIVLQTAAAVSAVGAFRPVVPAALYSGATIFEDTFTDADGTALNSHTSDSGSTWATHGAYSGGVQIDSNRAHGSFAPPASYAHVTSVSHSGDFDLQFNYWHHAQEAGGNVYIFWAYDPTVDSGYRFYLADIFSAGFTPVWGIARYDSGVQFQYTGDTIAPGGGGDFLDTEIPFRIVRHGSLMTVYAGGARRGDFVDTTYTSGRFGILTNGVEYRISDIVVSTVAGLTASGQSGADNLDLSTPLGGPVTLPLQTADAVSTSTGALRAATTIALDPAVAVSTASGALRAPTQIPLQAAAAVSTSTGALLAKTTIPLGGAGAVSGAPNVTIAAGVIQAIVSEVAFVIPDTSAAFQTVPLQPAGAVSGATATLTAKPTIALQTADAVSTASASLTAKATIPLQTAAAVSTASASFTARTNIVLQQADAVSTASASFKALTVLPLQTAAAVSAASAAITVGANTIPLQSADAVSAASASLKALTVIPLQTAAAVSAASASLKAISYVPLQTANAVSTATAFITVGAAIVPLQTANAVSTATITLVTARTVIPLGTAAAVSTASAEVRTTGVIPLSTANAVSTASLTVRTTAAIPLQTAAAVSTASAHVVAPHMFVMPTEQPSFLALADRGPRLSLPGAVGALAVLGNTGRGQLGDATSILDLHGPDDTSELAEPHERIIIDG